jgi:hypothetical protein
MCARNEWVDLKCDDVSRISVGSTVERGCDFGGSSQRDDPGMFAD